MQGRSYLPFVMGEVLPMKPEGWMILTRRLTAMFAALAVANEVIWRTMSNDAWVKIETFGFAASRSGATSNQHPYPILTFAFLWWPQIAGFAEHT